MTQLPQTALPDRLLADWQVVAEFRPQLKSDVSIYPQRYRQQRWYVVSGAEHGRYLRINEQAYSLVARFNGLTVAEIQDQIRASDPVQLPDSDAIIALLAQLYSAGLLQDKVPEPVRRVMLQQAPMPGGGSFWQRFNPLSIRIPLGNPDAAITALTRRLPGSFAAWAMIWCVTVGVAGLLGLQHADGVLQELQRDVIAPDYLLQVTLIFVLMKTLHELAHGVAVKTWGGHVREVGISLLVLAPIPYTDTSSAWQFQDKRKRMLVGAAGMIAELFMAALAFLVWLLTAPGMLHDLALQVCLIGAVSSLLFNANPLLKFDGYYILQDGIEIPNLYSRSGRYYLYLIQRYLLKIDRARSPVNAPGEARWFVVYGALAFCNRLFMLAVIVLFLLDWLPVAGLILAVWALLTQLVLPLLRGLLFLLTSTSLNGQRRRGLALLAAMLVAGGTLLGQVPVMLKTHSEGVVWVTPEAELYSMADGFVDEILVAPGSQVKAGQPVLRLNPERLQARLKKLQGRERELRVTIAAQGLNSRLVHDMTRMDLATVKAQIEQVQLQLAALDIRARIDGEFVLPDAELLTGRYIERGTLLGYIYHPSHRIIRSAVTQEDIGLIQQQTERAEIRVVSQIGQVIASRIERQQPAGSETLPHLGLGTAGGGALAVYNSGTGLHSVGTTFLVDLTLPAKARVAGIGEHAYVRFVHGAEPLLSQWLRRTKQLLFGQWALFGQ